MAWGIMGLSQEPQHGDSLLEWFDVEEIITTDSPRPTEEGSEFFQLQRGNKGSTSHAELTVKN